MSDQMMALWKAAAARITANGQPYSWSETTVNGLPLRMFDHAPNDMRVVWQSTKPFVERDYLVFENERLTYGDAHELVTALASYLASCGVGHGDRVAIAMRNYPEFVLSYWASLQLGAVVVGMNAWWVGPEFRYGLEDSTPKVLICDAERLAVAKPELAVVRADNPVSVITVRTATDGLDDAVTFDDAIHAGQQAALRSDDIAIANGDPACIFYTSGTTGFPKGAVLTHRSCVANLMNMGYANTVLMTAKAIAAGEDPSTPPAKDPNESRPALLVATPLFHVTANNCGLHPFTATGGKVVLMYRWDPTEALRLIEQEKISAMSTVPVMARELVEHPNLADYDTSSLVSLGGGGVAVQPDLVHKIDERTTSAPTTGYGLTETSGIISAVGGPFFSAKAKSVGPPTPVIEARIVDADGEPVPSGEVGELWVRGPNNVDGYFNKPEATAEAFTDGFFHTGDLAYLDEDNFLFIVDRAKDMVLRGGENIYCAEVEAVLFANDAVKECAVFAVPDDRLGEVPGAAVVLHDGAELSADQLRAFAAERMAKHKIPEKIWFVDDELPRNANGKFLKRAIRDQLIGTDPSS